MVKAATARPPPSQGTQLVLYNVELRGVGKRFGGIAALRSADFDIHAGEVHAIVGENGAGKSTLMDILSGRLSLDTGEVAVQGKPVHFSGTRDALREGIAMIHQELMLVPDLTVAENIFLSRLPKRISWRELHRLAAQVTNRLGFDFDTSQLAGELSVAQQQIVEVAKALSLNARVLIFDEPTAALGNRDARRLLEIIDGLRSDGVGVVYISHRLDEVLEIANRITVMKDGQTVASVVPAEIDVDGLIGLMVGRQISSLSGARPSKTLGHEVLKVSNLKAGRLVNDVSFSVAAGEIVGLGGLVGSGRTETARAIFGADRLQSGAVSIDGQEVRIRSPADAVAAGIGLVPEDRKNQGLVVTNSIRSNMTMASLRRFCRFALINRRKELEVVEKNANDLRIKMGDPEAPVNSLSGGNQQKVVIAKWLDVAAKVIILDEPTRGVDVGAKEGINVLVRELASHGRAVLVISSEHQELFSVCDRILVMGGGQIRAELKPADYSEERLIASSLSSQAAAVRS
jgi:ribose transport system ATP-binding protein